VDAGISVVLACIVGWVLVSARLARWSVTAPLILAIAGFALGSTPDSPVHISLDTGQIRTAVEITLALILFTDASKISARWFEQPPSRIAARLLGIGLPLTILAGVLAAVPLFPGAGWAVLAVVAAALAPTDAALGASIMDDERIPRRLRDVINVESGLNDGLATPFVLFFLAVASAEGQHDSVLRAGEKALVDLLIAVALGGALGWLGGRLLVVADRRRWSLAAQEPIVPLALALIAYFAAVGAGGNGFVAAFAAGVAFGTAAAGLRTPNVRSFTERCGSLLSFFVWFVFGAAFLRPAFEALTWQVVGYALLSLTLVRMVPVGVALIHSKLTRDEVLLIGWLGPRGLASIVFALIAIDDLTVAEGAGLVARVVTVTVAFSVVLHGLTAGPVAAWFSRREPAQTV
jgi:sodium/hydrogen antiporter